jgi:uncharacterized membrane protein
MLVQFFHVLIAIVALGTSAGLGIVLELYGNDKAHGPFVQRVVHRLVTWVVVPGYVLMLVTGAWLTHRAGSFATPWIQAAIGLWIAGAFLLAMSHRLLRRQTALLESEGADSPAYRRVSRVARVLGGGTGVVVVAILYFMVLKPGA